MKIYAHRGMSGSQPENSKSAVMEALNKGFDVEIDIRFTKDRKIVAIHDSSLARLCGIDVDVKDLQSTEITRIPFLSKPDESIPLFDDLTLCLLGNNIKGGFAIHFKQEEQNRKNCLTLSKIFRDYGLYYNCFLFNLSIETCKIFRELDPEIKLGVLVSDQEFEPFVYSRTTMNSNDSSLFDIVWAAEYRALYGQKFFEEAKALGKKIIAVSPEVNRSLGHLKAFHGYQDSWMEFLRGHIDGVCTDYPEEFSRCLYSAEN